MPDMLDLNPKVLEKIQADAAAFREDTNANFARVRSELAELREDTNANFAEVRAELAQTNRTLDALRLAMDAGFRAVLLHMQDASDKLDRRLTETNELLRSMTKLDDHRELEARVRTIEDHLGLPHGVG